MQTRRPTNDSSAKITSPIIIAARAITIVPRPEFTSAYPLFCAKIAPARAMSAFESIKPNTVILRVLIPSARAIFSLSPVAISACPNSVLKKQYIKKIKIPITTSPIMIMSKYFGKPSFEKTLKIVSCPRSVIFAFPITRKLMDKRDVIVKIPANKLGILQTVIRNAVTPPASAPAIIATSVAKNGFTPC